jgi:peptidyl-prolyl cis-trans isomerase B (cyclophilin B)
MKLFLPTVLLLLGACLGGEEGAPDLDSAAAPAADAQGRGAGAPPVIGQAPAPAQQAGPYQPKREPVFHFEPGGPVADADLSNYHVRMTASVGGKDVGTLVFAMWGEKAPKTVRNFLRYCDEGFYDGLTFHRILRNFMLQGGCPNGIGNGDGPHGNIPGEFSDDPQWEHHYGVLSMARDTPPDTASCQFFLVCAESASVWNLDGKYASFGKLVSGVSTLEALANAPTDPRSREGAKPTVPVVITKAEVVEGPAPAPSEEIARPPADLGGEAAIVEVQHVLISFKDTRVAASDPTGKAAKRTKEEAFELAQQVLAQAQGGADFTALVREHSDDPINPADPLPGVYRMVNNGAMDLDFERAIFRAEKTFSARDQELSKQVGEGKITYKQKTEEMEKLKQELIASLPPRSLQRAQMAKGFGDVGFALQVGEVGLAEYSVTASPFGWHIIKRIK